jgi:hypothetical protein
MKTSRTTSARSAPDHLAGALVPAETPPGPLPAHAACKNALRLAGNVEFLQQADGIASDARVA